MASASKTISERMVADLSLSSATVVEWGKVCSEVAIGWSLAHSEKLGGPGVVVEIDEAKFGKAKNNRGRIIEWQWVVGGIERNSHKTFFVPVQSRDKETLTEIIKEWVRKGMSSALLQFRIHIFMTSFNT